MLAQTTIDQLRTLRLDGMLAALNDHGTLVDDNYLGRLTTTILAG